MPILHCELWGYWWFVHLCSHTGSSRSCDSSALRYFRLERNRMHSFGVPCHGRKGWTHPCVWIQNGQDTWNTTHLAVLPSLKYFQIGVQSYFSPVQKASLKLRSCTLGTKLGCKLYPPQFSEHVRLLPWAGTAETTKEVCLEKKPQSSII